MYYDDLNLLSSPFFILVLASVEFCFVFLLIMLFKTYNLTILYKNIAILDLYKYNNLLIKHIQW